MLPLPRVVFAVAILSGIAIDTDRVGEPRSQLRPASEAAPLAEPSWMIPAYGCRWHTVAGSRLPSAVIDARSGLCFQLVLPGDFEMGGRSAIASDDELPAHRVALTRPYYLAATEVTISAWRRFARTTGYRTAAERSGTGWSLSAAGQWQDVPGASWQDPLPRLDFEVDERHPATVIDWHAAVAFCEHLGLRLPTEAEWEFACRAGSSGVFPWGDGRADARGFGVWACTSRGGCRIGRLAAAVEGVRRRSDARMRLRDPRRTGRSAGR